MLKIEGVHAGYPSHPVLHGVDLEVPLGIRLAVLGRNGVGKTTLVRTIVGSIPCTQGSIKLDGVDVSHVAPHKRVAMGIAHVPQGRGMFADLSVMDNLKVPARARHGARWKPRIDAVFDEFPMLAANKRKPAGSLSGGQQQALALARALLVDPRVLLLDEPTEGIQPSILDEIAELLISINERRGVTVILVEQKLDFAARVAADAVVLDRGRVRCRVSMGELTNSREMQRELLAV